MSNYKPNESKREEFRRYLERAGVLDALTKVLVMLYEEPEKPEDALEAYFVPYHILQILTESILEHLSYYEEKTKYIRKHLGGITEAAVEVEILEKKLNDVETENRELKAKLAKLDISSDE